MKGAADTALFWTSFWVYLAAFLSFAVLAAVRRRGVAALAAVLFGAGFALHTAGLAARWIMTTHPPFSTMYEYALTMAWAVALSFIVIAARFRRLVLGIVVTPILILVFVLASLLPREASKQLMPALQSYWFYIHVSLAALAEGAFLAAGGAGVLHLLGRSDGGGSGCLPSRELLEEIIARSIRIGYPLFTIGALFAGAIWAQYAWGSFWSWDPKETGALVVWLFYTLLLHQNVRGRWCGRTLAVMAIIGVALAVVSFIGNLFLGGMHAYI